MKANSEDAARKRPAIRVSDLTHRYAPARRSVRRRVSADVDSGGSARVQDNRPALDGVSFDVNDGEVFAVLGPNGSGKTTLFRILATLLRPTSGHAAVFGRDVTAEAGAVRRHLGVVFQSPSLDLKLTATENLLHQGRLYGLRGRPLRQEVGSLLDRFGLHQRRNELVERYSGGMRRRVDLAKALLHRPRLLLLDEPASGLDPGARRDLWGHFEQLNRDENVAIAFTTHLTEQAVRCDRLAILNAGRLVALDTPGNLTAQIGGQIVRIEPVVGENAAELRATIEQRFGPWENGAAPRLVDTCIHLEKADGAAFAAALAGAYPGRIQRFTVGRPTLEDVFLHLTGHTLWIGTGGEAG